MLYDDDSPRTGNLQLPGRIPTAKSIVDQEALLTGAPYHQEEIQHEITEIEDISDRRIAFADEPIQTSKSVKFECSPIFELGSQVERETVKGQGTSSFHQLQESGAQAADIKQLHEAHELWEDVPDKLVTGEVPLVERQEKSIKIDDLPLPGLGEFHEEESRADRGMKGDLSISSPRESGAAQEKLRTAMSLMAEAILEIEDAEEIGETDPTLDEGRISFIGDKLSKVSTVLTEISESNVQEGAKSLEHALTTLADAEGEGPPASLVSMISCFAEQLATQNDEESAGTYEVTEVRTLVNDSGVPIHYSAATVVSSTGEERQIAVLEHAGKQYEVELGAFEDLAGYSSVENIVEMYGKEIPSSSLAVGEPEETKLIEAVLGEEIKYEVRRVEGESGDVEDIVRVEFEGQEHDIQLADIANMGSPLPIAELVEQYGKLAVGGADPTRFTLRRKVEGGVIIRPDGASINATIFHVEKEGLPHRIATIKHDGKDYCVDVDLLESLDGSIPLSKIIEEHGHLAGSAFFDFIEDRDDRGHGDIKDVNGEDVDYGILEAIAGDGKVEEMAIVNHGGEDYYVDFDSLKRFAAEMPLGILLAKHGYLASEGLPLTQGQITKIIIIGLRVVWSFSDGKVDYTLVEIPENGKTDGPIQRKAVVKHQGQNYLVDQDTFEDLICGESLSQIIKKHGEVLRDTLPEVPSGASPVEVRYIEDVAGHRLKYLVTQETGNDKSGKYVAIVEYGGQRYGFDLERFENAVGSMTIAELVATYSRGPVDPTMHDQAAEIVSKQTIQAHDGRSEHSISEILSEHVNLSSKGLLVQDEGGVDRKTVFTTVSLAGPSGEREMAVVRHGDKMCYVLLDIMGQYRDPTQLAMEAIMSEHGMFVPNPEQEVRWMMCGDGRNICYNVTKTLIPGDFGGASCDVAIVLHDNVHCYVDLSTFEKYGLQMGLSEVLEKYGTSNPHSIVPSVDGTANSPMSTPPLEKRVVANEAGEKVAYVIAESGPEAPDGDGLKGRIRRRQVAIVPFNGKQYEIELGTFESLIRQQPVLFLIEEYGKLVQDNSPHHDALEEAFAEEVLYLVEECLDEDGANRVEKAVISIGKDDYELELEKFETLVSHMPLEEIALKHGTVRAKSQKNPRDLTLNTTREVDIGEKTLTSPSGRDIDVIVKERVFEEASQETGKIKRMRRRRLAFVNVLGVEYEVQLDVLEERLATMEIDDIARQFGIATLRRSDHSQEEGGDIQGGEEEEDVEPVLESQTVKGVSGEEITFLAEKTTGGLGGGEERQVALVGFEGALFEVDLKVFKRLAPKRSIHNIVLQFGHARTFLSGTDGQEEEGSLSVQLQECQVETPSGERVAFVVEETILDENDNLSSSAKKKKKKSRRRRKKVIIEFEEVVYEIELGIWEFAIQTMHVGDIVEKYGTVQHRLEEDDDIEEVEELEEEEEEEVSERIAYRVEEREVEDGQGKRQEMVAVVEFEINEYEVELETFKTAIDSMALEDIIEKYGKLCGPTGQHTLEIAPSKGASAASVTSLLSAAKVATAIVKSKKKAKKVKKCQGASLPFTFEFSQNDPEDEKCCVQAKKEKPRGNAAKVGDLMDAVIASKKLKKKKRKGKTVADAAMNAMIASKIKKGEKLSPPKKSAPAKEPKVKTQTLEEMAGWLQNRAGKMAKEEKNRLKEWSEKEQQSKYNRSKEVYGSKVETVQDGPQPKPSKAEKPKRGKKK
ncbi:hypothetical protein BSKO_14004 [Bryopsis sp. KO-2023]|nr:hypothetical protein BSKO_14004 [Bryopsis sp. KO-2023]